MFEVIETELARIRRMAELTDEAFLLYLIDIAIVEAKARSSHESLATLEAWSAGLGERRSLH